MSTDRGSQELLDYEYPEQTKENLEWADLEALDLSKLEQPGGKEALAFQVLSFIEEKGFFYVKNHGLTDAQIRRQYSIAREFFALPLSEKEKYLANTAAGDFRGYKPRAAIANKDNDERYNIPKFTPEHTRDHPALITSHWEEIKAFSLHIHNHILLPLLRIFAHALEIEEEYFVSRHRYDEEGLEYLRYMLYHPSERPLWAGGHTDYNTLTFLFHQPIAGLQVQTKDGWKYVRSEPDRVIVNVADALEFLSGGFLKSTVHRVVRPPGEQAQEGRLSLIYFARPESKVRLGVVNSPLLERLGLGKRVGEEALESVTAEEWARARIAKDHRFRTGVAKVGETEIIAGVHQKYYD